jgi:cation diffusion facilitator CzcD-associated flavoprotein CzcO
MIVNTLIVGGGPAGLAPLVSASRTGLLDRILGDGVALVERGTTIGAGRIGRYAIKSDSTANTLISCIADNPHPALAALRDHPVAKAVAAYQAGSVPLALVGEFMTLLGGTLRDVMIASGNDVFLGHEAISCRRLSDGFWRTKLRRLLDGTEIFVESRFVVMATGGHQPLSYLERRSIGGRPLLPSCADKLIQSDEALTATGLATIGNRLARGRSKRVAIVGSSSSAMACANAVLQSPFGQQLGAGAVTLLHRRPLHIFYPSAAEA